MRKHFYKIKTGAVLLAAACMLGGCGGQKTEAAAESGVETAAEVTDAAEAEVGTEETTAESEETLEETESESTEESSEAESEAAETAEETAGQAKNVTPQAVYHAVKEKTALPVMMECDDAFISNYYGINPADLNAYVFACAEDAALADSVIIMDVKDGAAAEIITAGLNTVIAQKAAEMENYIPEQYEIVAKSSVKRNGNFVYLVISKDAAAIETVIVSAIQ